HVLTARGAVDRHRDRRNTILAPAAPWSALPTVRPEREDVVPRRESGGRGVGARERRAGSKAKTGDTGEVPLRRRLFFRQQAARGHRVQVVRTQVAGNAALGRGDWREASRVARSDDGGVRGPWRFARHRATRWEHSGLGSGSRLIRASAAE